MKLVVVVAACILAMLVPVMAQQPPAAPDPKVSITLPASTWNTVLQALAKQPYDIAQPLIMDIQSQAAPQLKSADDKKKDK